MLLVTLWLLSGGLDESNGEAVAAAEELKQGDKKSGNQAKAYHLDLVSSASFVFHGCMVGTNAEALTDMAVTLALRQHLKSGRSDLGIANQCAVIFSMSLAYWTETAATERKKKATRFIMLWGAVQFFRSLTMQQLRSGDIQVWLFFLLVLVGRYVGPLGKSAQDTALLKRLERPKEGEEAAAATSQPGGLVPATLLWTMRMACSRLERPLCQLILLYTGGSLPIPLVSGCFTVVAVAGVLTTLVQPAEDAPAESKKTN